jgi:transglutaminase-like putative cysteine protease
VSVTEDEAIAEPADAVSVPTRLPRIDGRALVLAEVSLCLVTLALAATFLRLFDSPGFLPKLIVVAILGHLSAATARRSRLTLWASVPLVAVAGVLVLSWLYLPGATTLGIPTGRTLDAARAALSGSFSPFRKLVAPVPVTTGFELTMAFGTWVLAVFSDAAAFGGEAPMQALIPHATAFVGSSIFARHRYDVAAAATVAAASLIFLAAHRAARSSRRHWIQSEERRGSTSLLAVGASLAIAGVVAAVVVAPRLPGARTDPLVDLRSLGRGPGPVEVGNPLVGVGNLLGPQSDAIVFTATSRGRHYWRLTSLEDYDPASQQWRTHRSYREADSGERLPLASSGPTSTERVHVELSGLPGIWLPSPFQPERVGADIDLRYDPDSASVIGGGRTTLPDLSYDLVAAVPTFDPATATNAPASTGDDAVPDVYRGNPRVSQVVLDTLAQATTGATTQLGKMRALQSFFRDHFTYDQGVDYSRAEDPTAAFLTARRGFCQQFASTFAVMARLLGIPSRVAVGFTYGVPDGRPDGQGRTEYVVRGRQAHAWPEVYLDGAGWVPFEPTPGRGNPDAAQLTEVPPAQDDGGAAPAATTTTTTATAAGQTPTTSANDGKVSVDEFQRNSANQARSGDGSSVALWVLLGLVATAFAALTVRVAYVAARRRRRRGDTSTPSGRVRAAWLDSCEWLELVRVRRRPHETPAEFSRRAARVASLADLERLAEWETLRLFGDRPIEPGQADAAEEVARQVRSTVLTRTDRRQRLEHLLGRERRN